VFNLGVLRHFFNYYSGNKVENGVKNYSLLHFGWLSITLVFMIAIIYIYHNLNNSNKEKMIYISAALLVILYFIKVGWAISIGRFKADSMLPFHLCGIMVFIEFFAVFSNYKILKEFAYAAGLPGAVVAFLTPELNGYPLISFQYLSYIFSHFILIIIPLFWVFGNMFKPNKKYIRKIYGLMCVLALIDAIINKILNSNYMFISKAPLNTPLVFIEKSFGYKGYVVFLMICAYITLKLMYMPWKSDSSTNDIKESLANMNN
jgi:hypothetical integral membrane protein (TIGR02206 family)